MKVLNNIASEMERKWTLDEGDSARVGGTHIRDPLVSKTKGAPRVGKKDKNNRHCSTCSMVGHTKRNCPRKQGAIDDSQREGVATMEDNNTQEVLRVANPPWCSTGHMFLKPFTAPFFLVVAVSLSSPPFVVANRH
ncbi:hypothetical protein PIB30_026886 [Stylosanthes scabra]|uniref:CCHC-type domain-containing protein n=1 Tax=Stylosanthes scabra TaxID=79078 RepID=A0ABU6U9Q8_9FABA|nr:hypothetical protein [Stylosanthes scabra]